MIYFVATHASFPIRTRIVIVILFVNHNDSLEFFLRNTTLAVVVPAAAAGTPSTAATTAGSLSRSTAAAATRLLIASLIKMRLQEPRVVQFIALPKMVFFANRVLGFSFLPSSIIATILGIVVAYPFESASTDRLKIDHTAFQSKFLLNSFDILGVRAILLDAFLQCMQFRYGFVKGMIPNIVTVVVQALLMLGSEHIHQDVL